MYKVLCDGVLICDSRIEELALINPVVTLEENKAGSFSFTIPSDHPKYNAILRRKSEIQVCEDEEILFSGVCIEVDTDFYKQKKIYCEGELTYLNDSIQRPARYQGISVEELLNIYIANHNAQVEEKKQFQLGIVTVEDSNNSIYCYTNMESTMTCFKKDLLEDLGGILRVRHADGIKYIDYLKESQNINSQIIKLGKNLLDFTSNIDSTEIATAIIPLGAKLEQTVIEGLETRLTVESVNDGEDYVYSSQAVEEYGWIYKTVEFDDVTTPLTLLQRGEQYLAETQYENMVIEVKAIDLHLIDSGNERFKIYDQIRVISEPHGLDKYFPLTKMTLYLSNPENNTITLGRNEKVSLSNKISKTAIGTKDEFDTSNVGATSKYTGSFTTADGTIATVSNGFITSVS